MVCNICNDIASLLSDRRDSDEIVLGTVQEVVYESTCGVHPALLTEALDLGSVAASTPIEVRQYARSYKILFRAGGEDVSLSNLGWQELGMEEVRGRIHRVNNQWIDIDQILTWKDSCKFEHGIRCDTLHSFALDGVRPTWLIDCIEKCLVSGDNNEPYTALSYVWGQAQRFTSTKIMLRKLQQSGALSAYLTGSLLTAGIRDVLLLLPLLKERYLWVDCLCITQDDMESKQQEILKMVGIYQNASLTIVLASSLDDGIKGLKSISGPRNLDQRTYKLTEEHTVIQHLSCSKGRTANPWSKRAWTFQEGLFSYKTLMFLGESVSWSCQQADWYEDVAPIERDEDEYSIQGDERTDYLKLHLQSDHPSFVSLARLLEGYTGRDLTYVEDSHAAFSSILIAMGRSFKDGFVSGLPVVNFDLGLLWLPRSPMTIRAGEQYTGSLLPTWSWIAWQGELDRSCWDKGDDHILLPWKTLSASERILPLVHWSIPDWNGQSPRSIQNDWLSWRKKYMAEDISPPTGWTRHACARETFYADFFGDPGLVNDFFDDEDGFRSWNRPEMLDDPNSVPERYYTHDSIPGSYWYPIPLPDCDESVSIPVVVPYIGCETRLARLYGGERLIDEWRDRGAVVLRKKSGRFAGALRPNHWSPISITDDPSTRADHDLTGKCFDLVELSLGYCYDEHLTESPRAELNIDEWKHPERPHPWNERYEFYNIMWVIWRDGIAYRRGIGRAQKDVWESLDREHISLTLG